MSITSFIESENKRFDEYANPILLKRGPYGRYIHVINSKKFLSASHARNLERLIGVVGRKKMTMKAAYKSGSDVGAGYTIGYNSALTAIKDLLQEELNQIK